MKNISLEISRKLDKNEFEEYYHSHMPNETVKHFDLPSIYVMNRIVKLLNIRHLTKQEINKIFFDNLTPEKAQERNDKISKSSTGAKRSEEARKNMREAQAKLDHSHLVEIGKNTRWVKGQKAWNDGLKGYYTRSAESIQKGIETKRKNKTFNTSKPEEKLYLELCEKYGENDVKRSYNQDERYPYMCDFYIESEDLFIELNRHWTHGSHPFDRNNIKDLITLARWERKAEELDSYKQAINVWTQRDVEKYKTAKRNNLNYIMIY